MDTDRSDRLDSWKEIASYLKRSVRTVHRWETDEGLPVHRQRHKDLGSVFAYKQELDAWSAARSVPAGDRSNADERRTSRRAVTGTIAGAVALVSVVTTAAMAWRAFRSPAGVLPQLLPLASYPGTEGPPSLSPDGNLVAFAWPGRVASGPTDIYVKTVGSEALRRLTDTPESEVNPAWSPDGQSIAFVRDHKGVFTISPVGGSERRVSSSGAHVGWAADSKSVLIRDRDGDAGPFGIHQVFLDTLARRRLTKAPVGTGDWRFEVSPDGTTLAFIRYERPGVADLWIVPLQGGEPRRLTNWGASLTGLSWTPDGRDIVYSVDNWVTARLWRVRATSARPGRGASVPDIPAGADYPSISKPASGQPVRLAFQTITRDVDIEMIDLDSATGTLPLTSTAFSSSTRIEASARFSPDGSRIAFVSFRSGTPEIWVAEGNGNGLRQITSLGAADLAVGGWSPDGTRIAFDAAIDGNSDIYVVGVDGGNPRRLTDESALDGLSSWSGDGQWIYFASTRAGVTPDIWRVPVGGGQAVRVTHHGGFDPKVSADGQYLFYLDRPLMALAADGTARLMRAPVAGGQEELVLERVRPFLWAVTDSGIVFIDRERDFDAVGTYRFSDRTITRAGQLAFRIPAIFNQMTVSRDGRRVLATRMVRFDADLMRLDNFR